MLDREERISEARRSGIGLLDPALPAALDPRLRGDDGVVAPAPNPAHNSGSAHTVRDDTGIACSLFVLDNSPNLGHIARVRLSRGTRPRRR